MCWFGPKFLPDFSPVNLYIVLIQNPKLKFEWTFFFTKEKWMNIFFLMWASYSAWFLLIVFHHFLIVLAWYSLHINCGGKLVTFDGNITYDDDSSVVGPARFCLTGANWALINTGHFFDTGRADYYTWSNTTTLSMANAELYMDARVSPISLTYYAFCMGKGNYTVNLHFAEIMFTDDNTYSSLGRRVFDIYIQDIVSTIFVPCQ